jgi:thioredoxin reductase (NADPH)
MKINEFFCYFCFFFVFSCPLFAHQVVILGSGPAGLTAAIYASRAGWSTLLIEGEEPGGQIALSYQVDNFPGFPQGINGFELGANMREQALRFGTEIQSGKLIAADLSRRPFKLELEEGGFIFAETLIIASGASAKWLGLDSEKELIGKGVSSCATCDGFSFKGQEVVIVGGGDTALEDALFLARYASKITVIHRRNFLKASKYLQRKAFSHPNIHFLWNSVVEEILDSKLGKVKGVIVKNLLDQRQQIYPCQGVFIAIGHQPNTELFQEQLALNPEGYLVTKPFTTQTNIPGVFAAGDVADPRYQQAITAAASGCMAAMDADQFIQQEEQQ